VAPGPRPLKAIVVKKVGMGCTVTGSRDTTLDQLSILTRCATKHCTHGLKKAKSYLHSSLAPMLSRPLVTGSFPLASPISVDTSNVLLFILVFTAFVPNMGSLA